MKILPDVDIKALVFGAAIAAAFIIFGYQYWDWLYPFSAIGLIYAGYAQKNLKNGTIIGAFASTPIIVLTLQGYLGTFQEGFFTTENGIMLVMVLILIVGGFTGFVGAWAKRSRMKALEEYERKQNIGKNKKKKKSSQIEEPKKETKIVDKIFKK